MKDPCTWSIAEGSCTTYATGFRNSMGAVFHTNGFLYATDNGPNIQFGLKSIDCEGGWEAEEYKPDRLIRVVKGESHGHPNIARGHFGNPEQCVYQSSKCVPPLLDSLKSSTNGVIQYRSNIFDGALKGSLLLSRVSDSVGKTGSLTRVDLNTSGDIKENGVIPNFAEDSGLSLAEGPRGELITARVYKETFLVLSPRRNVHPSSTNFIGILCLHCMKLQAAGLSVELDGEDVVPPHGMHQAVVEPVLRRLPRDLIRTRIPVTRVVWDTGGGDDDGVTVYVEGGEFRARRRRQGSSKSA